MQSSSCFTRTVVTRGIGWGIVASIGVVFVTATGAGPEAGWVGGRSRATTGSGTDGRRPLGSTRGGWTPRGADSITGSWMDWTAWAAEMEPMVERLFWPAASAAAALHRLAAATCLSGLDLVARKHLGILLFFFPSPKSNTAATVLWVSIQ